MKFDDAVGRADIDVGHLQTFIRSWYKPGDLVSLVAIAADGPRRVFAQTATVEELMECTAEDIAGLCSIEGGKHKFNMYLTVFPITTNNNVSLKSPGTKEDIREVYGAFIDLDVNKGDVKEGVFESKDAIYAFLKGMEYPPTIIVDNGESGGVHAYWRVDWDDTEQEQILLRWWAYMCTLTDVKIDKLIDSTRKSRMPSGIYWPKVETDKLDIVRVVSADGPTYSSRKLREISNDAYEAHKAKITKTINDRLQSRNNVGLLAQKLFQEYKDDGFNWSKKYALAFMEERVNEVYDWSDILPKHGWTMIKEQSDGSKVYARPGQSAKSATVDYTHDDGTVSPVMSLFSESDSTGLSDLKEARIPLTKYQVMLRLDYDDDETKMVTDLWKEVFSV